MTKRINNSIREEAILENWHSLQDNREMRVQDQLTFLHFILSNENTS